MYRLCCIEKRERIRTLSEVLANFWSRYKDEICEKIGMELAMLNRNHVICVVIRLQCYRNQVCENRMKLVTF